MCASLLSALRVCVWEQKVTSLDVTHGNMHVSGKRKSRVTEKEKPSPTCSFTDTTHHRCENHSTAVFFPLSNVSWKRLRSPMCGAEFYDSQSLQTWWEASWCDYWLDIGEERSFLCFSPEKQTILQIEVSHSSRNIPRPPWRSMLCCKLLLGGGRLTHCSCQRVVQQDR